MTSTTFPSVGGQTSIGLELLQVHAISQIIDRLPGELVRQQQAWADVDRALADKLRQEYHETRLEVPPMGSYFTGVRLGVLKLPWNKFPTVTAMCDTGRPTAESARIDQGAAYGVSLWVESIVRSDAFYRDDDEERVREEGVVDRRAKRMLEALVQCITADRSLGGAAPALSDPIVNQTDPFALDGVEPGEQSKNRVFSVVRADFTVDIYPSYYDSSITPPDVLLRGS